MRNSVKAALAVGCAVLIGGIGVSAMGQGTGTGTGHPGEPPRRDLPRERPERPQRDARPTPSRGAVAFDRYMGALGRSTRSLGQVVDLVDDEAGQREALSLIQNIQINLIGAKGAVDGVPVAEKGMEEYGPDEASYRKAFRKHMIEAIEVALKLELAIMEGDVARAQEQFDKLKDVRDDSHSDFQPDEDAAPAERPSRERPAPSRER